MHLFTYFYIREAKKYLVINNYTMNIFSMTTDTTIRTPTSYTILKEPNLQIWS